MVTERLKENVILIDADYVDSVAYDLSENFEQMLFRHLPKADLAEWLICTALDGGIPEGDNKIQCIFFHTPEKTEMENFTPGILQKELDGLAFYEPKVGEFLMSSIRDEGNIMYDEPLMAQAVKAVLGAKEVKRLIIIPEMDACGDMLTELLREPIEGKEITLLTMQPYDFPHTKHVMLGYGIMHALGIKGEEI